MAQCSIPDCDKPVRARDLCAAHYARLRRHGDPAARVRSGPVPVDATCDAGECDRRPTAKGLCATHYARARRGSDMVDAPIRERIHATECTVDGCQGPIHGSGLCTTHYWRKAHGRPMDAPVRGWNKHSDVCTVEGCGRKHTADGICSTHYQRRLKGEPDWDTRPIKVKAVNGTGWTAPDGYRYVYQDGRRQRENVAVMEARLGRRLLRHPVTGRAVETVHHKNGQRADNRLSNLELWSSAQPGGQRVEDKVEFAVEMLRLYAPDRLREVVSGG